jgi:hypothetical protein
MPLTATVSTSGKIVVQLAARQAAGSRAASARTLGPPKAARRSRESPSEHDQDRPAASCPVGGEADSRREHDAGERRRGEQHRDLIGGELAPMEPDRQIR